MIGREPYPDCWHHCPFRAMGSEMAVWVETTDAGTAAEAFYRVEALFAANEEALSRFRPGSELSRLNALSGQWVPVSDLLWEVLILALGFGNLRVKSAGDTAVVPPVNEIPLPQTGDLTGEEALQAWQTYSTELEQTVRTMQDRETVYQQQLDGANQTILQLQDQINNTNSGRAYDNDDDRFEHEEHEHEENEHENEEHDD